MWRQTAHPPPSPPIVLVSVSNHGHCTRILIEMMYTIILTADYKSSPNVHRWRCLKKVVITSEITKCLSASDVFDFTLICHLMKVLAKITFAGGH